MKKIKGKIGRITSNGISGFPSGKQAGGGLPGKRVLIAIVLAGLLLPAGILPWVETAQAVPNFFEQSQIETQAREGFRVMIALWREELYFELYDFGNESTKSRISREDFAQRMVEMSWVPYGVLNPKYFKSQFYFRTMVYINARIQYRHKFNIEQKFHKDHTFLLLEEGGSWKIDLIQMIRSPFS